MPRKAEIPIILSNGKQAGDTINELRQQANRLNKEINNLKPGSEEFIRKSQDFNKVTGKLKEVRTEVNNTKESNNGLIQSFSQYVPFSGQINGVSNAIKGMNFGLKGTRAALIATGVGAFIVILGSLISYLTTTQAGIDKVTAVTRPLKAIFEVLKGVVQELGEKTFGKLTEAFNDPMKAIKDLGQAILDNIINRFKSLSLIGPALAKIFSGDLKQGFRELADAGIQLTTGITDGIEKAATAVDVLTDAVEKGIEAGTMIDQLQKKIELSEIEVIKRRRELEAQAKQLNFIVEDETKSLKEREAAALGALAAQKELQEIQLALANLKIEKMKLEHTLNDTSREDLKELAELEASRSEIIASVTEMETTTRNKLNILRKAQAAQEQKDLLEKQKAEEAARQKMLAAERNLQDLRIQLMEEGLQREIEKLWLDTDRKIEALTGTEEQITAQRVALEKIRLQEIEALQADYLAKEEEKKDAAMAKEHERQMEAKQTAISMATGTLNAMGGIFGNLAGLQEEGSEAYKDFATAQAYMAAGQAAINAYQSTAAIPIVGPTLAPIAAATALAFGIHQAEQIKKTKVGTPSGGGSLSGGGVSVGASSIGSSFNSTASTRGVSFNTNTTAAPVSASTTNGRSANNMQSSPSQVSSSNEALLAAIQNWPKTLTINNNLQDVQSGLNTLNGLQEQADL